MTNKDKLLTNAQFLKKGLNLLGRNRKTVLSHHKTFELTDFTLKPSSKFFIIF